jgi:DNA polymerase-3 subunit epsilon
MTNWPDGELLGFDLETTSIDPFTALPVSFAFVRFEAGRVTESLTRYVNPGVPIPPDSSEIHGITDEMVRIAGWKLHAAVSWIGGMIEGTAQRGTPLVGMNLAYDLTVIDSCVRRGTELGFTMSAPMPVIDLMVLDKHADQYRKGKRNLSALAEHYGVELGENAHDAEADVVATVACARALAAKYPLIARTDPAELHDAQRRWHREQIQGLSRYFVSRGNDPIPAWQMEWPIWSSPPEPAAIGSMDGRVDD